MRAPFPAPLPARFSFLLLVAASVALAPAAGAGYACTDRTQDVDAAGAARVLLIDAGCTWEFDHGDWTQSGAWDVHGVGVEGGAVRAYASLYGAEDRWAYEDPSYAHATTYVQRNADLYAEGPGGLRVQHGLYLYSHHYDYESPGYAYHDCHGGYDLYLHAYPVAGWYDGDTMPCLFLHDDVAILAPL